MRHLICKKNIFIINFTYANVSIDLDNKVIEVKKRGIVSKVVPTGCLIKHYPCDVQYTPHV